MDNQNAPLIVGAGPVGLSAAMLLARYGINARIIDQANEPAKTSRALAVNPRTLELLEPSGVTAEMLARGLKIHEVYFWRENKLLTTISLHCIRHRYPFILALSQAATEKLLTEVLQKLGKQIERGIRLTTCKQENGAISATLETSTGAQTVNPSWLLAADGAHSTVREQLKLGFGGSGFPELWYLADVPLSGELQQDAVHLNFFDDGGFLFMLRVVDDIRVPQNSDPLWRVLGNFPDPLSRIMRMQSTGAPVWESQFHISHRIASQLSTGNVYLAGDAAHIHSPMGARGMNLGIEDAWSFAELMKAGQQKEYGSLRHAIDQRVVRRVQAMTTVARGQSALTRLLRLNMPPLVTHIPFLYRQLTNTADGLDHEVQIGQH